MARLWVFAIVVLGVSCGSNASREDAGAVDSGAAGDAGEVDAGRDDAGVFDAGVPDAGGIDAGVNSSHGRGGITCLSSAAIDATHSACLAEHDGTRFKLTLPAGDASGPYTLGVYLHGDGAGAYNSNSAVKRMLTLADAKNVLQIAVLAPNGCSWWQTPSTPFDSSCMNTGAQQRDTSGLNTHALAGVIEAVRAAYDVRDDRLLYYAASGGSIFLTRYFVPIYGSSYPGAMAITCGGERPDETDFSWPYDDAEQRGSSQLFFVWGDQDALAPDVQSAASGYAAWGFPVDEEVLAGIGHCGGAFDAHAQALEVWTQVLGN